MTIISMNRAINMDKSTIITVNGIVFRIGCTFSWFYEDIYQFHQFFVREGEGSATIFFKDIENNFNTKLSNSEVYDRWKKARLIEIKNYGEMYKLALEKYKKLLVLL